MSENVTVDGATGTDVVFTHVRAKSVPDETFKTTYARLAVAGKTAQEIADELGMNKASVVSRASALRKVLSEAGIKFPFAKTERGKGGRTSTKMPNDKLAEFLKSLDGSSSVGS